MTNSSDSVDQPLVSVVIPTYNRSKELSRAIKSVLSQTYQNFEILVVDDGSEEDLRIVCDSFNDNRIRFYRNEQHTNANVARNRGIKEAKGEYIAMLDSDDEYMPHHLQRRIEKIKEWECDGIFGSAYVFDGESYHLRLSRPLNKDELMINYLLSHGVAYTPSHFYHSHVAKDTLWDESLFRHQDFDFSVRFAEKYDFRSDYEPTIIINWHKNTNKHIHLESCMKFLTTNINQVNTGILIKYAVNQSLQAQNQDDSTAIRYYRNILVNNIIYISLVEWFIVNSAYKPRKKVLAYFSYIYRMFLAILT